jgi:hypothetical protein
MQNLSASVGPAGALRHEAALVQAMLCLTERPQILDPTGAKYLSDIDGDCGPATQAAIVRFQNERLFVNATGRASAPVPGSTPGTIRPGDPTWMKLVAGLPTDRSDLRVLSGSKTVYVAGTQAELNRSIGQVGSLTFSESFRSSVTTLVNRIYSRHGIVVGVCKKGDRRDFQTQYELYIKHDGTTNAGPGESNHNFGQAVDMGFAGLRWLRPNATIVANEDSWMHQLDPGQQATGECLFFWNMLRDEGTAIGLFRGPVHDRPHLQAWSDNGIDMADRLAVLMTRVGKMKWAGQSQKYKCDLGLSGELFDVGSADVIWARTANVTAEKLKKARAQNQATPPVGQSAPPQPAVTEADVTAMRNALRDDFAAADAAAAWPTWTAR